MKKIDVVRALRDKEYRDGLAEEERALVPESAAPLAEIDDEALKSVTGGCCPPGSPFASRPACSCVPPGYECP